jgi:hypothetical protein
LRSPPPSSNGVRAALFPLLCCKLGLFQKKEDKHNNEEQPHMSFMLEARFFMLEARFMLEVRYDMEQPQ